MNYAHIADALDHFKHRGYVYVRETPWIIQKEAYYATKPADAPRDVAVSSGQSSGYLVASGEQGFLQMMLDGRELKRAICVTPCFRTDVEDRWHQPYFMKAELINADDPTPANVIHMVHDALSFFERYVECKVVETGAVQYDILEKRTRAELGSYGIRHYTANDAVRDFHWIYGTACAEPRLSLALQSARDL